MRIIPKTKIPYLKDILEIILAFIAAWLFYQGLSFAANTPMPIVSVVSDSMYHKDNFDSWWVRNENYYRDLGIEKSDFLRFTVPNGFARGDLILLVGDNNPKTGDVVIYNLPGRDITIIHRVVEVRNGSVIVKGDNNAVPDPAVKKEAIIGRAVFAMPILGWPRLALYAVGI